MNRMPPERFEQAIRSLFAYGFRPHFLLAGIAALLLVSPAFARDARTTNSRLCMSACDQVRPVALRIRRPVSRQNSASACRCGRGADAFNSSLACALVMNRGSRFSMFTIGTGGTLSIQSHSRCALRRIIRTSAMYRFAVLLPFVRLFSRFVASAVRTARSLAIRAGVISARGTLSKY